MKAFDKENTNPLSSLEVWEDDVLKRYPEPGSPEKSKEEFRNYDNPEQDSVQGILPAEPQVPDL